MNKKIPVAASLLALALAACGDRNDVTDDAAAYDSPAAPMAGADMTPGQDPADMTADAGTLDQRRALEMVVAVDEHEIAAAEQAREKDVDQDVLDYANTLHTDHTRNLEQTRQLLDNASGGDDMATDSTDTAGTIASTDGLATDPAMDVDQMREKHEQERERLAEMEGDEYQRAWLEAMVQGHQEALGMLDNRLIPAATDSEVQQHLNTAREAIARHLETAQGLQGDS